jgi:hypothetical protein
VKKSELLRALQQEIRRHDLNYFVHEPPSIAQGVVVPGCPACKKRINTNDTIPFPRKIRLDLLRGRAYCL